MSFRVFKTAAAVFIENTDAPGLLRHIEDGFSFNVLFTSHDPAGYVRRIYKAGEEEEKDHHLGNPDGEDTEANVEDVSFDSSISFEAPIGDQEVWAAGVTYFRSRTARMEEAETAGGDVFYDKVYEAERPELFFKATAARTRGHLDHVGIRSDSTWDVPEPEFTLAISSEGKIFGHTIGNDMSSRSIEGENPLYLPQAKNYTGACSLGPCLVVADSPAPETTISISISRAGSEVFSGETSLSRIKRSFEELAGYLFRCNHFKNGAYLMTGTGIVPDSRFSLLPADIVSITIEGIGTLTNTVERV